ncbi:hypothetical protein [Legionella worsleiensis]|uniref:Uncharacterized protein n=1 Tax=Legionella worsleiensis TaxID=45076 RepID=A0A0W1AKQ9_9GAMM|nr:hypothetical protein [Legionella worsleiensis]KTD81913.1 hypothetical protein Lwor_0216 [Legionella worsleiensis]STY31234.1 Uncharacterised protein [Legionella worsleiensis]
MFENEPSKLTRNTGLAGLAIEAINKRFPLGALNRKDVVEALPKEIYEEQLLLLFTIRNMIAAQQLEASLLFPLLQAAQCGEMTFFAVCNIEETCPEVRVEAVHLKHHEMVVIGRKKRSDPLNILTWGENAVICDPWAKMTYKAVSFFKVRDETPHIPFFRKHGEELDEHYLAGNPVIIS